MTGAHGGSRPGAGRKPGPVIEPDPPVSLLQRLEVMPAGKIGRQRRGALALAYFGATDAEISSALCLPVSDLLEFYGEDVEAGRRFVVMHARSEIIRSATGRGRPFSISAAKAALRMLAPTARPSR